tara:strand:+ start:1068 stop:1463 length:396 start_codon:yes stop_codon:yes gene_type:complete
VEKDNSMALVIMIGEAKRKPSTTKGKKKMIHKKKKTGMNMGGQLKKPNSAQAGLKKLPESVRNKMGFMAKGGMPKKKTGMGHGGMSKKKTGMMYGGMMPKKKKTAMMGGGMTDYRKKGMFYGGMTKKGNKK